MKSVLMTILYLTVFMQTVSSLKCYVCSKANGNCITGQKDCGSSYKCMKIEYEESKNVYKLCASNGTCSAAEMKCGLGKCKSYCCDGSLCNSASVLKCLSLFSVLLLSGMRFAGLTL
ncbi:hypothetical protein AC249_AIPGENE23744 [Exaiptasia diaphana]|nr:hypothetical protein AC249_AIPGENE23744 [Exaiptasia diaphana]